MDISTILGCLEASEPLMNVTADGWYRPSEIKSPGMDVFLANQLEWRQYLEYFRKEMRSFATPHQPEVVTKMVEWKMQVPPPPSYPGNAVYMISQKKELVNWLFEGTRDDERVQWPEILLNRGLSFYESDLVQGPVVGIKTDKKGDTVYVARYKYLLDDFQLLDLIQRINKTKEVIDSEYSNLQMPCIFKSKLSPLNWILGMRNAKWYIAYAMQNVIIGVNENGAGEKADTVMASRSLSVKEIKTYYIAEEGQPFIFWKMRDGVAYPQMMHQFLKKDFEDPGDLSLIVA